MKHLLMKNLLTAAAVLLGATAGVSQTTKEATPPATQISKADSSRYAALNDSTATYFNVPSQNPLDDVFKDITMSFIKHTMTLSDLKTEDNLEKYRSHRRTYLFKSLQLSEAYRLRALNFLETMQAYKLLPP
jgi:hypothetical protein